MNNEPFKSFVEFISEADIKTNPAISPEYFDALNARGHQEFSQNQRKYGRELANFMQYVKEVASIQRGHEKELEDLAKQIILDQFGSILGETKLDIKIPVESPEEIKAIIKDKDHCTDLPSLEKLKDDATITAVHKRKILNMIAQGEALNAKKLFTGEVAEAGLIKIFGEQPARKLIDLLIKITDFASMTDWVIPEEVAAQMWKEGNEFGGASKIEWKPKSGESEEDEDDGEDTSESSEPTIVIRGLDFAMLIHEAIKGIYGLINQRGLSHLTDDQIVTVFANADTERDEIQDIKRAKLTAADLRDFLNTFPEVLKMENGREYVWGKMIDAQVVPDKEFLSLMRWIFDSLPLYKQQVPQVRYSESQLDIAKDSMEKAKKKIKEILDLIKQELSDWEDEASAANYDYDEYEDDDQDNLYEPAQEQPAKKELSQSQIRDMIDSALDRRDYPEVSRLSKLLLEKNELSEEEEANSILDDLGELLLAGLISNRDFKKQANIVVTKFPKIKLIHPALKKAMNSPEYAALVSKGFVNFSNDLQLLNGTLSLGTKTSTSVIVIYQTKYIRRIPLTSTNRDFRGSLKKPIAQVVSDSVMGEGQEMYINAFKWILHSIDVSSPNLKLKPKNERPLEIQALAPLYESSENRLSEEEALSIIRDLAQLRDAKLITKDQYYNERRRLNKESQKINDTKIDLLLAIAMKSKEYKELLDAGFINYSTRLQLQKGTIALTTKTADKSIVVYKTKYIRRVSKEAVKNYFGRMIIPATVISNSVKGEGEHMYINAFKWILANIDVSSKDLLVKKSLNGYLKHSDLVQRYHDYLYMGKKMHDDN